MNQEASHYAETWKKPHFIKSSFLRYSIYLATIAYFFLAIYTMEVN
jgi:hypothetical protein